MCDGTAKREDVGTYRGDQGYGHLFTNYAGESCIQESIILYAERKGVRK